MKRRLIALLSGAGLLGLAPACAEQPPELTFASADQASFEAYVYPVLLRDCGFHACHGSHERFFQVFGPGHGRLRTAPPTLEQEGAVALPGAPGAPGATVPPSDPAAAANTLGLTSFDPPSQEELTHSYQRAISMIDNQDRAKSLLLRKPLGLGAGGVGHEGVDRLGRDVYQNGNDPCYQVLQQWVMGLPITAPYCYPAALANQQGAAP